MVNELKIYIGTSGWSYDHWIGKFYPEDLKRNQWIKHLAQHFNSVELNMSFYRFPFKNMLQGWYNKLPDNFQMTMKANRNITHRKKFKDTEELLEKFYNRAELLKEKIGCILFQAPPSFHNNDENFQRLEKFQKALDDNYRNVFEFRHESWWQKEVYDLFKKNNSTFCIVSGLNMPEEVKITSETVYFRFHGPGKAYASRYSAEEIKNWANKIKKVANKEEVENIYCYFNNDMEGFAVDNAKELKAALSN
ncbi:MAG: DUF72 domain-containing protein [Candidatus Marinimicrobia bacterium]|nr:DUF72 domain-containing protein [Candidatus Neomarinimicrobiota bacterium]